MTQSAEFNSLVKTIVKQSLTEVPLDVIPQQAILSTFNHGAEIKALAKHHTRYSDTHGRIFPMYDEDEGIYDVVPSDVDTDDVVEDLYYQWSSLENATSFLSLIGYYEGLLNVISSLASWHPNYNDRNGHID